jgi:carbon-monoxide dehydrogenase small subunit
MMKSVSLRVNGVAVTKSVAPRTHLADFLREELHLTGTHIGCEHGVCGACTVMVDGHPVRSCISYAVGCSGSDVRTIEGFDDDPVMKALREAFSRHHALQCGYCTPGMLATAYDIVTRLPDADEARIREELSGNLCRCTGYVGIVGAVREVLASGPHSSLLSKRRPGPPAAPMRLDATAKQPSVAGDHKTGATAAEPPSTIEGGTTLRRTVEDPVDVERLWSTLQDIETVARCLPGATIESIGPEGSVSGAIQVSIGLMRARFAGTAHVRFDGASHSGEVRGTGSDRISRSRADGAIRFAARPAVAAGSQLALEITYKLGGPLAQFGRPAVVAGVVDRLLADFAQNLARASKGEDVAAQRPIKGVGFLLGVLSDLLKSLFSGKPR